MVVVLILKWGEGDDGLLGLIMGSASAPASLIWPLPSLLSSLSCYSPVGVLGRSLSDLVLSLRAFLMKRVEGPPIHIICRLFITNLY